MFLYKLISALCRQIKSFTPALPQVAIALALFTTTAQAQMVIIPIPGRPVPAVESCSIPTPLQLKGALDLAAKSKSQFWNSYAKSNFFTRGDYRAYVTLDAAGDVGAYVQVKGLIQDTFTSTIIELVDPKSLSSLKVGDTVTGRTTDILDWMYKKRSKWYGHYLFRARLSNCPDAIRKEWLDGFYEEEQAPKEW